MLAKGLGLAFAVLLVGGASAALATGAPAQSGSTDIGVVAPYGAVEATPTPATGTTPSVVAQPTPTPAPTPTRAPAVAATPTPRLLADHAYAQPSWTSTYESCLSYAYTGQRVTDSYGTLWVGVTCGWVPASSRPAGVSPPPMVASAPRTT